MKVCLALTATLQKKSLDGMYEGVRDRELDNQLLAVPSYDEREDEQSRV